MTGYGTRTVTGGACPIALIGGGKFIGGNILGLSGCIIPGGGGIKPSLGANIGCLCSFIWPLGLSIKPGGGIPNIGFGNVGILLIGLGGECIALFPTVTVEAGEDPSTDGLHILTSCVFGVEFCLIL